MKMRQVRKNYDKWKKKANVLQSWVLENFEEQDVMGRFIASIPTPSEGDVNLWLKELESEVIESV